MPRGGGENGREGIAGWGPEDARCRDGKIARRQDVIQTQAAEAAVEDGIQRGVALVGGFGAAMAAARGRVLQRGMRQKGEDGPRPAVTVCGIEIGIPDQQEGRLWRGCRQVAVQKAQPEGGLVMVAAAIPIFGSVEDGGRGMPDQEHEGAAVGQGHGQLQMAVRGKALDGGKGWVGGRHEVPRQIAPEEAGVIRGAVRQERQARQDRRAAGAGKPAPALGIGGVMARAVAIGVMAGGLAAVGARGVEVGIGGALIGKPPRQRLQRKKGGVVIHPCQDKDIGIQLRQDGHCGKDLRIAAPFDVLQQ